MSLYRLSNSPMWSRFSPETDIVACLLRTKLSRFLLKRRPTVKSQLKLLWTETINRRCQEIREQ